MGIFGEKKLGFGLMRLPVTDPGDPASIDIDQLCRMVDLFLERGFTYFDTAWMYNGFASEKAVRAALVERHPRESFTLATKAHSGFFQDAAGLERMFADQLEKTGAGHFDFYLLHDVNAGSIGKFEEAGAFGWLAAKREAGLVRHAGFSFHDTADVLDRVLERHPEAEFVQLQVNYLDWESEFVQSRACLEVAVRHGKQVIVMEPVKGGTLADVPEAVADIFRAADPQASVPSWAVRFAASQPGVGLVLSGMSTLEQVEDNTGYMADFGPLTEEEQQTCFKAADAIKSQVAIACTGCSYCTPGCPLDIAIPQYFALYNDIMREDMEKKGWTVSMATYSALSQRFGRAGDCIGCGQCEAACPQHLGIIDHLKSVAGRFE